MTSVGSAPTANTSFSRLRSRGQSRMYVRDLSGGPPKPITPDGVTGPPSPDGTLVAFEAENSTPQAARCAAPDPWIRAGGQGSRGWTGDSRALFLRHDLPSEDQQVFRLELATGRRTLLHEIARLRTHGRAHGSRSRRMGRRILSYSVNQSELFLSHRPEVETVISPTPLTNSANFRSTSAAWSSITMMPASSTESACARPSASAPRHGSTKNAWR